MENIQSMAEIHKLLRISPDLSKKYEDETVQISTTSVNSGAPLNLPIFDPNNIVPQFGGAVAQPLFQQLLLNVPER